MKNFPNLFWTMSFTIHVNLCQSRSSLTVIGSHYSFVQHTDTENCQMMKLYSKRNMLKSCFQFVYLRPSWGLWRCGGGPRRTGSSGQRSATHRSSSRRQSLGGLLPRTDSVYIDRPCGFKTMPECVTYWTLWKSKKRTGAVLKQHGPSMYTLYMTPANY